jgi:hypothetical protein
LTWDWSWWGRSSPLPIFLFGYLTFYLMCFWVYDMETRARQLKVVASLYGVILVSILVFGVGLKWI